MKLTHPILGLFFLCIISFFAESIFAQKLADQADSLVSITLKDGTTLIGKIIEEDEVNITFLTSGGVEAKIPKSSVDFIKPFRGKVVEGKIYRFDPNYARLMFTPTGRPLGEGHGYFSDLYIFFPGIAYWITDNVSFLAGFSISPFIGIKDQIFYIATKVGGEVSEKFAVSGGALYSSFPGEFSAGIVYAVGTCGRHDGSVTGGIGFGYSKDGSGDFEFSENPVIMLGANVRLSNSIAFLSENWIITGERVDFGDQPKGLAIRFFGDRIAFDLGVILIGSVLEEGFPIPWLSVAYHFGR